MFRSAAQLLRKAATRQMATAAAPAKKKPFIDMTFVYGTQFDKTELIPLGVLLTYVGVVAAVTFKRTMISDEQGAYINARTRGNVDQQAQHDARYTRGYLWELTRLNQDKDGYQIGVFRDHSRPHDGGKHALRDLSA